MDDQRKETMFLSQERGNDRNETTADGSASQDQKIRYSVQVSYQSKLQVLDTIREMVEREERINFRRVSQACGWETTTRLYHSSVLRRLINHLREMANSKEDVRRNKEAILEYINQAEHDIRERLKDGESDYDADYLNRCRRLQRQLTAAEKEKAALLIQLGTLAQENQKLKEKLYSLDVFDDEL